MKITLVVILAVMAVYVNAAVIDPKVAEAVLLTESLVVLDKTVEPRAVKETEPVEEFVSVFSVGGVEPGLGNETVQDDEKTGIAARRLLFSQTFSRSPIVNTIQRQVITIRFNNPNIRITSIWAGEIGPTQFAMAHIIDGGLDRNFVTISLTTATGRGYNIRLEIYGV